jgi:hypothetical protein
MFSRTIAFAVGVASVVVAPESRAQSTGEWTTVTSACVPDEDSTGKFVMTFGSFEFKAGATGSIDARCNITNPDDEKTDPGWGTMELTLNDPDGAGAGSQIVVYLRRVHKSSGGSSDLQVFDSNLYPAGQALKIKNFNPSWDFATYAYYIAISVRRTGTLTPRIQRIRLLVTPAG